MQQRHKITGLGYDNRLDFSVVEAIRACYAPTASLLSTMKAVVKYWPRPAVVLTAEYRGRRNAPYVDQALRITVQNSSVSAPAAQLKFWPNMRVPMDSPMDIAFRTGTSIERPENLSKWSTSAGDTLADLDVHTAVQRIGNNVYALIEKW